MEGQLIFNDVPMMLKAASSGFGLACVLEDHVEAELVAGTLVRMLENWCLPFSGYLLSEPRQPSAAFALRVEALRYHR